MTTDTPATVRVAGLTRVFGEGGHAARALDGVDLNIAGGEFFTLLGPSGCGKTTLLRLIAGLETPSAGTIHIDGRDVTALGPDRRPVNTVFQHYALFPHLSVTDNIGFGLRMLGWSRSERASRVEEMLALVRLEDLAARRPDALSGGQQQRVALARALAPAPRVLLLDEPLSALDVKLRRGMQDELKRLQRETRVTCVFVTHDQDEALALSDRVAVLRDGRVLQVDTPIGLYESPVDRVVADFVGDANFLDVEVMETSGSRATVRVAGALVAMATVTDTANARPGDRATAMVRPERVQVGACADAALAATVEDARFEGSMTRLRLRLDDGAEVIARVAATQASCAGERVGLTLADGALRMLAK